MSVRSALVFVLLCLFCATSFSQRCDGGYPTTQCQSATLTNGVLTANCNNGACAGCPTCKRTPNPVFSKQCSVNVVLILDNTGSLSNYCNSQVRPAISSFVNGLMNIARAGGTINTAVIAFENSQYYVFPMQPVTQSFTNAALSWVAGNPAPGNTHPGYCTNMGGTNWAGALQFANNQNYGTATPDIFVWFTDGYPQCAGFDAPQTSCSKSCFSATDPFFSDLCANPSCQFFTGSGLNFNGLSDDSPSGLWASCPAADALKARAKLFLVGVGGVGGKESFMQLVTGKKRWDGQASTFGLSDYIVDTNYDNLGIIFQQTLAGLCSCLQAQPSCVPAGDVAASSCAARQFSARVLITTQATTTSTVFPPSSTTPAFIYYSFLPAPDTRVAYEFFSLGTPVNAANPTIIRTDIIDPCFVQRQVQCGQGCFTISEKQLLPRFFHETGDTACGGATCAGATFIPTATGCTDGYIKASATSPEQIKFLWTLSNKITPCAAQALDGTIYEFSTNAGAAGVMDLGATPNKLPADTTPYSFAKQAQCTSQTCATDVEVVFVVDEQDAVTSTDFSNIKTYVANLINSFTVTSPFTRFGIIFTTSYPPNLGLPQVPVSLTGLTAPPNLITNVIAPKVKNNGTTDFASAVLFAINKYWPSTAPANGVKRELITIVGGPDAGSGNYASVQAALTAANVEAWTVGVNAGAPQAAVLSGLASSGNYIHYSAVLSSSFLPNQLLTQAQAMCPQSNLCGPQCQGFCTCAGANTCQCPTCAQLPCSSSSCTNPSVGCLAIPRVCDDHNSCTDDTCVAPAGCKNTQKTCTGGANCVCVDSVGCVCGTTPCTAGACPTTPCYPQVCVNNICIPDVAKPSTKCDDGDFCTTDSCDNAKGGCQYTKLQCPQVASCFSVKCFGPNPINGNQPNCSIDITAATPCDDSDACTIDRCLQGFGCLHTNYSCTAQNGTCNFPSACVGKDANGQALAEPSCIMQNVTCGLTAGQVAGISVGVIVGVTVAAVACAALIAYFSRKGYLAYQAKSALAQPSMQNNAMFRPESTAGYTQF